MSGADKSDCASWCARPPDHGGRCSPGLSLQQEWVLLSIHSAGGSATWGLLGQWEAGGTRFRNSTMMALFDRGFAEVAAPHHLARLTDKGKAWAGQAETAR